MCMHNKLMEKKFNQYVGKRIAEHRDNRGVTQKALAALVGFSRTQLQNYEYGVQNIGLSKLLLISSALKISLFDFLPTKLVKIEGTNTDVARLLEHHKQISRHTREARMLTKKIVKSQVRVGFLEEKT